MAHILQSTGRAAAPALHAVAPQRTGLSAPAAVPSTPLLTPATRQATASGAASAQQSHEPKHRQSSATPQSARTFSIRNPRPIPAAPQPSDRRPRPDKQWYDGGTNGARRDSASTGQPRNTQRRHDHTRNSQPQGQQERDGGARHQRTERRHDGNRDPCMQAILSAPDVESLRYIWDGHKRGVKEPLYKVRLMHQLAMTTKLYKMMTGGHSRDKTAR